MNRGPARIIDYIKEKKMDQDAPKKGDTYACIMCDMRFVIIKDCACDPNDPACAPSFKCCGQEMAREY